MCALGTPFSYIFHNASHSPNIQSGTILLFEPSTQSISMWSIFLNGHTMLFITNLPAFNCNLSFAHFLSFFLCFNRFWSIFEWRAYLSAQLWFPTAFNDVWPYLTIENIYSFWSKLESYPFQNTLFRMPNVKEKNILNYHSHPQKKSIRNRFIFCMISFILTDDYGLPFFWCHRRCVHFTTNDPLEPNATKKIYRSSGIFHCVKYFYYIFCVVFCCPISKRKAWSYALEIWQTLSQFPLDMIWNSSFLFPDFFRSLLVSSNSFSNALNLSQWPIRMLLFSCFRWKNVCVFFNCVK